MFSLLLFIASLLLAVNCQELTSQSSQPANTSDILLTTALDCLLKSAEMDALCYAQVGVGNFTPPVNSFTFTPATCCPYARFYRCLEEKAAEETGECKDHLPALVVKAGGAMNRKCAPHIANCPTIMATTTTTTTSTSTSTTAPTTPAV